MADAVAMASQSDVIRTTGKSRLAGVVLVVPVMLAMILANLPYQYVQLESEWCGAMEIDDSGSIRRYQTPPRMAGWPFRYWVQYQTEGTRQDRFWSLPRLIANLSVAIVLGLVVYGYLQLRCWQLHRARNRKSARMMFDVGIASLIVIVPAAMIARQHWIASQHRTLARKLLRYGNTQLAVWLPEALVDQVPTGLMPAFQRIRQSYMVGADEPATRAIAKIPSLVGLQCHGGSYTTEALQPLAKNVHFCTLTLSQRNLNDSDLELIAGLPWLTVLKLPQTNVDSQMLRRLDHLRLRSVDLTRTPLQLSQLGVPRWSETVEELYLTRPQQGVEGSLTIEGWPRLRRLRVSRLTSKMNDAELKIRLVNLPNLKYLSLDRLQKHNCVFHDLPRWSEFGEGLSGLRFILRFDDMIPGLMWLSNLDIAGIASLKNLGCFARDLESISIRDAPNLRELAIGSYNASALGDIELLPANARRCQSWVDQIGNREGPSTVDFTALPLADADLSPLVKNRRIRHLRLGNSGVTFEQIQRLAGMEQLESLDVGTCRLKRDQLSWLLQRFPQLQKLVIDGSSLTRLDLSQGRHLKAIRMTALEDVKEVRIVDLPSLRAHVRLLNTPQQLDIRNAPSLLGLAIESPWPRESTVDGLRDLEWFAGGGPSIDDKLADVILQCHELDQLTFAYTSVTAEKLKEIGSLHRLSLLAVPGAPVDDSVTAHWRDLDSLWEINLDDTSISVQTLAWLSRIESLRRLTLNRVAFNETAADALAELKGVSELHLENVSLPAEKLQPILQHGNLETLNLSGWRIDDDLSEMLAASSSLRHLIVHNTDVDSNWLKRILTANPRLYVDWGDDPHLRMEPRWTEELQRRAIVVRRDFSTGWRNAMRGGASVSLVAAKGQQSEERWIASSERAGRIDSRTFRPKSLTASTMK